VADLSFDIEDAIEAANQAMASQCQRKLSDLEVTVLQGVWEKLEYGQIAIQTQYATSYISQDVAPRLWKLLSAALGEKVRKSNCRTALQRYAEKISRSQNLMQISAQAQPETALSQNLTQFKAPTPTPRRMQPALAQQPMGHVTDNVYVERHPIEQLLYKTLLQPGSLARVKAPRFMGKTTLINHVLAQLPPEGYRVAQLSLEMADRAVHFSDLNRFLRWFCLNVSRELGVPSLINDYWDEAEMGAKVSCTAYFEEYLLTQDPRPLVLCLDNIDLLFPYPAIYEDFFGLLRSWYEKARTRETWSQLRLVVVHATDVYIRLKLHQSPFNVGIPLELPEFTPAQVQQLATLSQIDLGIELQALIQLLGGHPALLDQAFKYLRSHPGLSIQQLLEDATTESSIFGHHLREQLLTLENEPDLAQAFQQVVNSDLPITIAPMAAYQLQSMGLIQLSGNRARSRCELYRTYFRNRLSHIA